MAIQAPKLTTSQKEALKTKNVSDSIRFLDGEGYSRADIARILGKRYQHVRNVLVRSGKEGERRKKTTFTLQTRTFAEFERLVQEIGLRRDSYLSGLLEVAISALAEHPANSPETFDFLKEYYRPEAGDLLERDELVRVNINLDDSLLDKINRTCSDKRVPRDLFLDGVLEVAVAALTQAAESISDPIYFCDNQGIKFCGNYLLTDAEVNELRQQMIDAMFVAQAISIAKDITFGAAQKSYSALPLADRQRIQKNPEILEIIDRLKETSDSPIDLDDLIE